MKRRHLLAVAGSLAGAGCLGSQGSATTSTATQTPQECPIRPVLVANGRNEQIKATVIYLTAEGEVGHHTIRRVPENTRLQTLVSDSFPDFATVSIIDGTKGQPDVTVPCHDFPTNEPLLVYFHPAGDIEVRNAQSDDA